MKEMTFNLETVDDLFKLKDLKGFDGIYIGGGNTWSLIQEIKDSNFYTRYFNMPKLALKYTAEVPGLLFSGRGLTLMMTKTK